MDDTGTRTSMTLLGRVALTGDEDACARFVNRYGPMVKAITKACRIRAQDGEDIVQAPPVLMNEVESGDLKRDGLPELICSGIANERLNKEPYGGQDEPGHSAILILDPLHSQTGRWSMNPWMNNTTGLCSGMTTPC